MAGFSVPGYDVVEPLAAGRHGERWLGREQATGATVVLECVRGLTDLEHRDRLRREVAVLAGLRQQHLLSPRTVVCAGEELVLVGEHVPGEGLPDLLAATRGLSPGQVVTLAVPLADALAALHRRGLVHGAVGPEVIHVAGDGRPMLAGAGGYDGTGSPEDDVRALAAACLSAMRADAGGRVRQVLDAALRAPAGAPPDASGLARALFDAGAALPIRVGDGSRSEPDLARRWSAPAGGRHRASRPPTGGRRVAAVLVLAAVGVVAAAAVGVGWAEVDPGPEPAIVGSDSSHRTWSDVLADLDALRSRAFATADASALAAVYTDRSPALDRDRAALARLARAGLRTEGLRLDAVEVVETSRQADRVLLRVADVLGGYRLVDASGAVVDTRPGRGRTWWTVTLVRAGGRWKVYDVARG